MNKSFLADLGFYGPQDAYAATVRAVDEILAVVPSRDKWCVEFGAWDGIHGSNTRSLIVDRDYFSVQIEGDEKKFLELQRNYAGKPGTTTLNQWVGFGAEDGLDAILKKTDIPRHFEFCCIDIDGNDYHVWKAMGCYRPKVVCIEFNPTIPPEVSFIQEADPSVHHGCSLSALIELGVEKGYELVSVIGVNAFFVDQVYFPLFGLTKNGIYDLWTQRDCITYFFTGYDGRVFLRGCQKLPWQEGRPIDESRVQVVPRFLRKYPYQRKRRVLYECLTSPAECLRVIRRRLAR
jgi:hypothetical protein